MLVKKKHRRQNGSSATQEVGGTGGAEQASGSTATKSSAHVGAFSVLNQNQADHADRRQNVHRQHHRKKIVHITSCSTQRRTVAGWSTPKKPVEYSQFEPFWSIAPEGMKEW